MRRCPLITRLTTAGAFDTTSNGNTDVFVTKLNLSGSAPLVYSTFRGDVDFEIGLDIAVDTSSSVHVTGVTQSSNFPTTVGAFDTTHNGGDDAFVTKLSTTPGSTPGCAITNGGWIIAENGATVRILGVT